MIKVIVLPNQILIGTIEEITSELGEPDCKITKPHVIKEYSEGKYTMEPWLSDYTKQDYIMIHSDKILTLVEPKPTFIEQYETLIN